MPRQYSMKDATDVAKVATADIERWLRGLRQTRSVANVEDDPAYQRIDVDLIWVTQTRTYQVEIKGDRWQGTGNFFFETQSNAEQQTPGCFLYTEADLLFYYFVHAQELYILPMPQTRDWFLVHMDEFKERATTTLVGNSRYTTVGRLTPIQRVLREVDGVRRYNLSSLD
ncbi:MAG: hypothetical protein KF893_01485 [Caldilineaceae bacterium]|nr:hypothetical protein [Caldilineaceae bacterium]